MYKDKGCGFLEPVYQECLKLEFAAQDIPFLSKSQLQITYQGKLLEQRYSPDFICFEKIILEIKAASKLADKHRAQIHNYLKATGFRVGLLVNIGHFPKVEHERIIR